MLFSILIFLLYAAHAQSLTLKPLVSADEVTKATREHKDKVWWHYCFPTTGLYAHPRYFPPRYTFIPHHYTLDMLAPKKGLGVRIAMIDVKRDPQADLTKNPLSAHAAHAYRIMKEGLCPKSEIICLYLEKNDKAALIQAVKQAAALKPDILLLNLKLGDDINPDTPLSQLLNTLLHSFPYVIAAAGNDGHHTLAYPAHFSGVTFSVGAFGIKEEPDSYLPTCYVPSFSQRQPGKGPTFLGPGVQVLSKAHHTDSDWYLIMSGTSTAASIIASAVALFLGEYKSVLSKEESIEILAASGMLPAPTNEWLSASTSGILDTRTALFIGHLASRLKKRDKKRPLNEIIEEIKRYLALSEHGCPFTNFTAYARTSAASGLYTNTQRSLEHHAKTVLKRLKARQKCAEIAIHAKKACQD